MLSFCMMESPKKTRSDAGRACDRSNRDAPESVPAYPENIIRRARGRAARGLIRAAIQAIGPRAKQQISTLRRAAIAAADHVGEIHRCLGGIAHRATLAIRADRHLAEINPRG